MYANEPKLAKLLVDDVMKSSTLQATTTLIETGHVYEFVNDPRDARAAYQEAVMSGGVDASILKSLASPARKAGYKGAVGPTGSIR
jgi:hypothetical protein